MELLTASSILIFISTAYFPICLPSTTQRFPGWGSVPIGWQSSPSIISALAGGSGALTAAQETDLTQTISIQASGQGMNINFTSNLEGVAGADLGVNGGVASVDSNGATLATMNETTVSTNLVPVSQIGLEMEGADIVDIDVSSQALGWEHIDAEVNQGVQAVSGNHVPSGGWKRGGISKVN